VDVKNSIYIYINILTIDSVIMNVQKLQTLEKRIIRGRPILRADRRLWWTVVRKLRVIVGRYYERKEFPAKLGTAICTIVKVKGKSYGYCTYLFLLIPSGTKRWAVFDRMSTEERGKLLAQKQNIMEQRRKVMWRNEVERKRERREAMRKKARGLVRDQTFSR